MQHQRIRRFFLQFVVIASIIGAGVFTASYNLFDEITAASTGYNATAKGLFSWAERYQEHEFDQAGNPELADDGIRISPLALTAEIGVSILVGIFVALFVTPITRCLMSPAVSRNQSRRTSR